MARIPRKIETVLATVEVTGEMLGEWYGVMREDPCPFCGTWMTPSVAGVPEATDATKDHIEPRAAGGFAGYDNIVMVCRTCNGIKANKTLLEHLMDGGMKWAPPAKVRDVSRSRHRAAWTVLMARRRFGDGVCRLKTRGARKRRQLIAWTALMLGAHARHVASAMSLGDHGASVVEMAKAWDRKRRLDDEWARRVTREFVEFLREQMES